MPGNNEDTTPSAEMQPWLVVENTRRVTVRLADGVTPERFVELLNKRYIKIEENNQLTDGSNGAVLGQRLSATNTSDYKVSKDQAPFGTYDTLDPYEFRYNEI
jgi:hypothetical protein